MLILPCQRRRPGRRCLTRRTLFLHRRGMGTRLLCLGRACTYLAASIRMASPAMSSLSTTLVRAPQDDRVLTGWARYEPVAVSETAGRCYPSRLLFPHCCCPSSTLLSLSPLM